MLTGVPGLGAKKAERIIVELKGKFKHLETEGAGEGVPELEEYLQVLTKLGFTYTQAKQAIRETVREKGAGSREEIVKEALKRLGK